MFPKLRVIFSIGAGVDQFDISEIPEAVKVVRMLDPGIADCVAKYVTLATLTLHRRIPQCLQEQRALSWNPKSSVPAHKSQIGLVHMGRDEHLCEQGLLEALDSGQLQVATLDVMQNEPSAEN